MVFRGNTVNYKKKKQLLEEGVMAKDVRFWPKTYHEHPCMRVEIFGEEARPGIHINYN